MKVFELNAHQLICVVVIACFVCGATQSLPAQSPSWVPGDVFVGIGNNNIEVYHNNGTANTPDYQLIQTLDQNLTADGETTGCTLDSASNLYTTNFQNNAVVKFDASSHTIAQTLTTGSTHNESMVFASNGDFFVGHADGDRKIERYNAAGLLLQSFTVATEDRGSDWIDLSSDQHTIFYTSEGTTIKRFNVSTSTPLPDFATGLPGPLYALRLLPPGDGSGGLLVADTFDIKRLDENGNVVQTYDASLNETSEDFWFALNLDPDGTSFWAGGYDTGVLFKFDIATGNVLTSIQTGATGAVPQTLAGVCVKGESAAVNTITQTVPPNTPTAFVFNANDPINNHAEKFTTPTSCGPITMSVTANEVDGDGFCTVPVGGFPNGDPNQSSDFDCRLIRSFGTVSGLPACTTGTSSSDTATRCSNLLQGTVVTVPHCIPYTHGHCVFYRVEPPKCASQPVQEYITWNQPSSSLYTPSCNAPLGNPRMFDDPSDPSDPYNPQDHQFIFDVTTSFNAAAKVGDPGTGGRTTGTNDWVIADRCNISAGSAAFLKPVNGATSKLGSAIPVQVRLTSPSNAPITDAANKMTLEITDSGGNLVPGFGTSGNSPGFWTYNSTANYYSANLKTTKPPFNADSYKLCVSSSVSPPEFFPSCVTITLKK
jgi:hypothetical protein